MKLPTELASIQMVFHVSMVNKSIGNPGTIIPIKGLGVKDNFSYEKVLDKIRDRKVKRLSNKEVASWKGATLDVEADMNSRYPHLFLISKG